ncbi:MAG: flagellar biosynthetic protein FliR [Candidatus Eremiobacteraeota bacterium]|nr:flagellar biosynthetic protein FliR [Candidatus Eremiobacteraeota bacterium]NNM93658.1 flagellar biosynthetic protein FliR [Candidatus Eremiobacteraeota bacterium]
MLDIFGITAAQFQTFFLIFVRVSTMLFVFPIFSAPQIPIQTRFGLGALLSFLLLRTVPTLAPFTDLLGLVIAILAQIGLGAIVGYIASLVFAGIQFAGELIDLEIGYAIANVISPTTQQQVTIIGEFELALATLIFLATNSHLLLIAGIAGSFNLVPLPYIHMDPSLAGNVVGILASSFDIVFKIAAPAAIALFITNISLALMARVAPQMNVFVVGFPIQVTVGLITLAASLPLLATVGPQLFDELSRQMDTVMRSLR